MILTEALRDRNTVEQMKSTKNISSDRKEQKVGNNCVIKG